MKHILKIVFCLLVLGWLSYYYIIGVMAVIKPEENDYWATQRVQIDVNCITTYIELEIDPRATNGITVSVYAEHTQMIEKPYLLGTYYVTERPDKTCFLTYYIPRDVCDRLTHSNKLSIIIDQYYKGVSPPNTIKIISVKALPL